MSNNLSKAERRLTCNRIFRHLTFYHLQGFTGKITVFNYQGENWNFYLALGNLMWADGGNFPLRRWRRQVYETTGELPDWSHLDFNIPSWDFKALWFYINHKWLSSEQIKQLIQGIVLEVLFDVIQAFEAPVYQQLQIPNQLLPITELTGIGDGMQIDLEKGVTPAYYSRLRYELLPPLASLQEKSFQMWKTWVQAELACLSPNDSPILVKPAEFQSSVSQTVYSNFKKHLKGTTSLRDLSFKLKCGSEFTKLGLALAPYYQQNIIQFHQINDLTINQNNDTSECSTMTLINTKMTLSNNQEQLPLLVSVSPNDEDKLLLNQIAQEQNCQLLIIDNNLEALYKLNQSNEKPSLIFAPKEMSILTGGEFCHIIRRLDLLKATPIIIYTYLFHKTKKMKNLPNYGATEILDYNQFTYNHVSSLVLKYSQQKNDLKATIQQNYDLITKP